jgi:hypothetical protein
VGSGPTENWGDMTEPLPSPDAPQQGRPGPTATTPEAGPAAPTVRRAGSARLAWGAAGALLLLAVALAGALAWDDSRLHQDVGRQSRRSADLAGQVAALHARNDDLSSQLASLRAQNGQLQGEARNPTLAMWNSCGGPCGIGPSTVRVGSVPDTFQLLITFTSDVPVRVYVFTFHQWTQFDGCGLSTRCVTGGFKTFDASTSIDTTFAEAEGCSGYVWVLQADRDGTITPNVRVHYQPADRPTGVCAGNP